MSGIFVIIVRQGTLKTCCPSFSSVLSPRDTGRTYLHRSVRPLSGSSLGDSSTDTNHRCWRTLGCRGFCHIHLNLEMRKKTHSQESFILLKDKIGFILCLLLLSTNPLKRQKLIMHKVIS